MRLVEIAVDGPIIRKDGQAAIERQRRIIRQEPCGGGKFLPSRGAALPGQEDLLFALIG